MTAVDRRRLTTLRRYIEEGRFDKAGLYAVKFLDERHRVPDEVWELMNGIALKGQISAWTTATMMVADRRRKGGARRLVALLTRAIDGEDRMVSDFARTRLGLILIHKPDKTEIAMQHLDVAYENDSVDATLALALIRRYGFGDVGVDFEDAAEYYSEAIELHDSDRARVELATMILENRLDIGYDPRRLIMDAAENGDEHAMRLVAMLPEETDSDDHDNLLSHTVVPDDVIRLRIVKNAIAAETEASADVVEGITAALHGFPDWGMLVEACRDKERRRGLFDEECSLAVLSARHAEQVSILMHFLDLSDTVATIALQLLRPTAKSGPSSLATLRQTIEDRKSERRAGP